MRIGINGQLLRDQYSGVDYYIYDLIQNLAVFDQDNEYVLYINATVFEKNGFTGERLFIKKTKFPNRVRPVRILWEQACLPFFLLNDKIDLFHAPGYITPLFSSVPSVVTIHDVIALRFPGMCTKSNRMHYKLLLPFVAKKARRIITVSQNSKKDIVSKLGVNDDKIDVIPHGVHPSYVPIHDASKLALIREKYNIPERIILFVGNLEPKKNIERIIEAFHMLKINRRIEHTLVIAGKKGWLCDGIFKKAGALGLDRHIKFLGYVPRTDLPLLYNAADVFVFPSLYEGFGIPPMEAMACGTPVVTSNVSALPEVVGEAGITVDPRNVGAIADGIFSVIADESLKSELMEKGLERAKLFSCEKAVKETLNVYRKVMRL